MVKEYSNVVAMICLLVTYMLLNRYSTTITIVCLFNRIMTVFVELWLLYGHCKLHWFVLYFRKVLKEILVGELAPDETVDAVSEAKVLSKLNHPGIVKFHDSFIDGESFCIVTEYCEVSFVLSKPNNSRTNHCCITL
jgi:serine/threonine protein kinase